MDEFLKIPWVVGIGWLLGVLGWIVGLISGFVQLKSYVEQRAMEKGYITVLEQAKRDWQGKYTDEQIEILTKEMVFLKEKIERDIPEQARRVFLENQLSNLIENMGQAYEDYNQVVRELGVIISGEPLGRKLEVAIEQAIMPTYLRRKHETQQLWWLLAIAVVLLIIVNWNYLMGLVHTSVTVSRDYPSRDYPLSWLIVYLVLTLVLAWLTNQTHVGKWLKNISIRAKSAITNDNNRNYKTRILHAGFPFFIVLFFIELTYGLVSAFMEITQDVIGPEFGDPIPMPLSVLPVTVFFAFLSSIILLFLFYSLQRKSKSRRVRS